MKTIFVGAGHSEKDPGAVANGFTEAQLVTELRDLIAKEIESLGGKVLTDGAEGENQPLPQSIALAKTVDGVKIELHLNAGPSTATGVEVLGLPEFIVPAQKIAAVIARVLGVTTRGKSGFKLDSEGQHPRLAFCRQAKGLIVEVFFITNTQELAVYQKRKSVLANSLAKLLIELSY